MSRTRVVAGCMTGTSLDGLDVALAEITGHGLEMSAKLVGMVSRPLGDLADSLRDLASGRPAPPLLFMRAGRQLGLLHADAVEELCRTHLGNGNLDFVVAHGQTIWHAPDSHLSWQILDPWPVARKLKVAVCYDLRQADLLAGGQGAPITPLADWVLYSHDVRRRFLVNLGGICNVTDLPPAASPGAVRGEDIGPCNLLIDTVVQLLFPDIRFDRDGKIATEGKDRCVMFEQILEAGFFTRPRPRTTGREDFGADWVRGVLERTAEAGADAVASAVGAVSRLIAQFAESFQGRGQFVLAGGGARNNALVRAIIQRVPPRHEVVKSDALGIPCEAREPLGIAVLGALSQDGVPITLPRVTGAKEPPVAGAWITP